MAAKGPVERQLILLRHAKAEKTASNDHERELSAAGRLDAAEVGRRMRAAGLRPDLAVVSTATRTRQTWQLAAAELDTPVQERFEPVIFDNRAEGLLELIRATPKDVGSMLLVGHSPSIAELAVQLEDGSGDPALRQRMAQRYPTGAFSVLTHGGPWSRVGPRGSSLAAFVTLRE